MSPKTSESGGAAGAKSGSRDGAMSSGRITVMALVVLALVLVFQNTRPTRIRLLVHEVTVPLWMALLGTGTIGALCGAYCRKRRE
ncbi:LapA family protein [Streptomyces sp. NPDC046805]|uniref:LapA family protein n=1 Tax=Streptomyces sp. NPDC046805 TaxID=3155134 RepID=UPI0033FABC3D